MADKYNNNMQGVLFKKVKEKETSPDYGGECEIAGVKYWISSWLNTSQAGNKFLSLRFKVKDPPGVRPPHGEPFNDEIPF